MALARTAVSLGRSLREQHKVRVRQPLASMTLVCAQEADRAALECMAALVADELNVREVVISEDESALVTYEARPNLKLLGPRLGKQLGEVRKELGALTSEQLSVVVAGGSVPSAAVEGLSYDAETLLVDRRSREGLAVATEAGVTVALDLELTEDLRLEGLAREVVNRIQGLRKERDLALDDRIALGLEAEGELARALDTHWDLIAGEVLATRRLAEAGTDAVAFEVEGSTLRASLVAEV
jgi:isoleucyl-tRNA synthetase